MSIPPALFYSRPTYSLNGGEQLLGGRWPPSPAPPPTVDVSKLKPAAVPTSITKHVQLRGAGRYLSEEAAACLVRVANEASTADPTTALESLALCSDFYVGDARFPLCLSQLSRLTRLNFNGATVSHDLSLVDLCRRLPALTSLEFAYCKWIDPPPSPPPLGDAPSPPADAPLARLQRLVVPGLLKPGPSRDPGEHFRRSQRLLAELAQIYAGGTLTELDLSSNELAGVPDFLCRIPAAAASLTKLTLADNPMVISAPDGLLRCLAPSLRELSLARCGLCGNTSALPQSLALATRLRTLHLDGNPSLIGPLSPLLPAPLLAAPHLVTLLLDNVGLTEEALRGLCLAPAMQTVRSLNLCSNASLAHLPAELSLLSSLHRLALTGIYEPLFSATRDFEQSLDAALSGLLALNILVIDRNRIAALPASLSRLVSLRMLECSYCRIAALPPALYTLNLTYWRAEGNCFPRSAGRDSAWDDWSTVQSALLAAHCAGQPLPLLELVARWVNAPGRREQIADDGLRRLPQELRELIRQPRHSPLSGTGDAEDE